jgi:lipoyl(octanoyl) transferase
VLQVSLADLGPISYQKAWDIQEQHLQKVIQEKIEARTTPGILPASYFFLVEHPPVFTLGKSGKEEHLLLSEQSLKERAIEFFRTNRGGDITFHGLGQLVGYPIFDLDQVYTDIHRYLRDMEEVVILTLADFGIPNGGRKEGLTGVWVGEEKICAMGVRASRWVTMHGFALNVNTDLRFFDLIVPCGIQDKGVTSMEKILGHAPDFESVKKSVIRNFERVFPIQFQHYEI